jgi:hypothetical protein
MKTREIKENLTLLAYMAVMLAIAILTISKL